MQLEIPFRTLDKEATNMMDQTRAVQLTIRGAAQEIDSSGNIVPKSIRVVVSGRAAKLTRRQTETGQHYGQRCDPEHPLHLD